MSPIAATTPAAPRSALGVPLAWAVLSASLGGAFFWLGAPREAGGQEPEFRELATDLEVGLEIGRISGPEPYQFARIGGIGVGPDSEIVVLDVQTKKIRVFDHAGGHLVSFGRPGAGPGEFQAPSHLRVDSLIRVSDFRLGRESVFRLDGTLVNTAPFPSVPSFPVGKVVRLRSPWSLGVSVGRYSLSSPERHQPETLIVLLRDGEQSVDTLLVRHGGGVLWHPRGKTLPYGLAPSSFGAGGVWAVVHDTSVVVADGYRGLVRWYCLDSTEARACGSVELGLEPRPITEADLDRVRKAVYEDSPQYFPSAAAIQLVPPPSWSVASQMIVGEGRTAWVRTHGWPEEGQTWTVAHPTRGVVARYRLPAGFSLRVVTPGRLYGVVKDELDVQRVRVYEWERGEG